MERQYKRGVGFPNEGFIQIAIERHFEQCGYTLNTSTKVDLLCVHPNSGEAWHIEAKGMTTEVGLDFRTCLGQLVQRMEHPHVRHGIALPDLQQFRNQAEKVSSWVIEQLGIHWLFVAESGALRIEYPVNDSMSKRR